MKKVSGQAVSGEREEHKVASPLALFPLTAHRSPFGVVPERLS